MLYNFLIFEANQNIISSLRQKYNLTILLTRKKNGFPLMDLYKTLIVLSFHMFFLNPKEKYLLC